MHLGLRHVTTYYHHDRRSYNFIDRQCLDWLSNAREQMSFSSTERDNVHYVSQRASSYITLCSTTATLLTGNTAHVLT